jgi:hypothetical protein
VRQRREPYPGRLVSGSIHIVTSDENE